MNAQAIVLRGAAYNRPIGSEPAPNLNAPSEARFILEIEGAPYLFRRLHWNCPSKRNRGWFTEARKTDCATALLRFHRRSTSR
jgi:hypothetical protein